ncbi:hypothetical protein MMMB2_5212 [Mycobacterium marinum MB2]|nr:hypothetical protein MMMB2_5212 [Mycobacterium marinum MB2]
MISLYSHQTRRSASTTTTAVMPIPTVSLMSICVVTEVLSNAFQCAYWQLNLLILTSLLNSPRERLS